MPTKTVVRTPFNLQLDETERNMLMNLIARDGTSGGAVFRAALRSRYYHICTGVPTCSNGQPCFVPQMHASMSIPIHTPLPAPKNEG